MERLGSLAYKYLAELVLDESALRPACEQLLAAVSPVPWPKVTTWQAGARAGAGRRGLLAALRAGWGEEEVWWRCGEDLRFHLHKEPDGAHASIEVLDTQPEHAWRWLVALEELLVRLREGGGPLRRALVERIGEGCACLPRLSVMGGASYLVLAEDTDLEWAFEQPELALREGGWEAREVEECWLLSRAMHAETNVELLEAIWEGQWAMARLAKPGHARYDRVAPPLPEEEPIAGQGERRVLAVGYEPDRRAAVFSYARKRGFHVNGWEILALRDLVLAGQLATGEPVERVEVLFADRVSAERERRPLLDVGVSVFFADRTGERIALVD